VWANTCGHIKWSCNEYKNLPGWGGFNYTVGPRLWLSGGGGGGFGSWLDVSAFGGGEIFGGLVT
jgi:hypothetical protein